jgi:hypothetical protein
MARRLGRALSTLSRELARNAQDSAAGYDAMVVQTLRAQRRVGSRPAAKLAPSNVLWGGRCARCWRGSGREAFSLIRAIQK